MNEESITHFNLQEEIEARKGDPANYQTRYDRDFSEEEPMPLLEAAIEQLSENSEKIQVQEIFDLYRCLFRDAKDIPFPVMNKALDSLLSGMEAQAVTCSHHYESGDRSLCSDSKLPLELYVFLLDWFISAADLVLAGSQPAPPKRGRVSITTAAAVKKRPWSWVSQAQRTAEVIAKVLNLPISRMWLPTPERANFISFLIEPVWHVAERAEYMKIKAVREAVSSTMCSAVVDHDYGAALHTKLMISIPSSEHLAEHSADWLHLISNLDEGTLAEQIVPEIAGKKFGTTTSEMVSAKHFSRFLSRLAELQTQLVYKQLPFLLELFGVDCYHARLGVIDLLSYFIQDFAKNADPETLESTMENILNLYKPLLERMTDINSYVRTRVLAVLRTLAGLPKQRNLASPVELRTQIALAALTALEDKSMTVKKASMALLIQLVQTHPFEELVEGGELCGSDYKARREEYQAEIDEIEARGTFRAANAVGAAIANAERPHGADMDVDRNENGMDIDQQPAADNAAPDVPGGDQRLEYCYIRKKLCQTAVTFIDQIEGSMTLALSLTSSTSDSLVEQAIEFFRVLVHYKVETAEAGLRQMMRLVWRKDDKTVNSEEPKNAKGVRQRLLDSYKDLYFTIDPDRNFREEVTRVTKTLIDLTVGATLAELTNLEEIMRLLMVAGDLDARVVTMLWDVYASNKTLPKTQRRGSIIILAMLGVAKPKVVLENVDKLLRVGLGPLGKADLTLAKYTCLALQRLNGSAKKIKGSMVDRTQRLERDHEIFRKLQDAIEHPCRSTDWFPLAEQAINTIYALSRRPDLLCSRIIKTFMVRALSTRDLSANPDAMDEDDNTRQTYAVRPSADAFKLSQLLFVVGHVALKQIVFLGIVESEYKRRRAAEASEDSKENLQSKTVDELEQIAGNADEEIVDRMTFAREAELLFGENSLLRNFGPLLVHTCNNHKDDDSPTLRAVAVLSLAKFLCVSRQFCEENHQILFDILESSQDANVRANISVALGDVTVSFHNIIDAHNHELYKGLSDADPFVKKNTLMVLSHLIINGMIKVKGQLGEIARCIADDDERISDLAKSFFAELATNKENEVYNNLPDVISHLSVGEHAVAEPVFHETMTHIFKFVVKEKHIEAMAEKLCHRFQSSENPRQWRDITFCLSLLHFKSDRFIKKLSDGFNAYRDKLHEPAVFQSFSEILAKARSKHPKDKSTEELDEFEKLLNQSREMGEEEEELEKNIQNAKRMSNIRGRKARRKAHVDDDNDGEEA